MTQTFKSIYFKDHPAKPSEQRHIRLAFSAKEHALYEKVKRLSSEEIRQLLSMKSFDDLVAYSSSNSLSINRACKNILQNKLLSQSVENTFIEARNLLSDPLIATYRGGNGEFLHDWYPFLEAFPPAFVKNVLTTYAPKATRILDPFAGIGTTPLTIAALGLTGFYCELNPTLQVVTNTKYRTLQLTNKSRHEIAERLDELAFQIGFRLGNEKPDEHLRQSYYRTFQQSKYFDNDTFEDVLRLRTLSDNLSGLTPLMGQLLLLAVLSSLVPSSLLIRRGDLRYKTPKELSRVKSSIRSEVSRRLEHMAKDIIQLEQISGQAVFVAEDAQSLALSPSLRVECIITSPPYLNGTNYIRNTKIELWFLRALNNANDLNFWRSKSLTAGINAVTKEKGDRPCPNEVKDIIERVKLSAYDRRIPKMIASYFREFGQIFSALSTHLTPKAIIIIDIGDSRYGGVHVETDRLLSQIAHRHGFSEIDSYTLRVRKSHDGGMLKQRLLIFEFTGLQPKPSSTAPVLSDRASHFWNDFKSNLPYQLPPYSKRNWGHPLHSLCSYQGKMKPSIAHFLVRSFMPENGKILDPFAGVGTIPFEACLQGGQALGFEISPTALAISIAKVSKPNHIEVYRLLGDLKNYIETEVVKEHEFENAKQINFNHSLDEFYHEKTFRELLLARRYFILQNPSTREWNFVLACLLHILHGNRPYALSRRSHPVTPFAPSGTREYRPLIDRLRAKVERSLNVEYPREFCEGTIYLQDATSWWPAEITDLDAIITSPPFFDSTRFYLTNWIRLWFCGWEREDFNTQPLRFVELKQKHSMKVYESVYRQARERLKPDGIFVMHLGRSNKCNMARELSRIAEPWFRTIDIFEEDVSHCESHGIVDKGTVTSHQYLILL